MSNMLQNNNQNVDNSVDKVGTTTEKVASQGTGNKILQIIVSSVVAVLIALIHEYIMQSEICETISARPETAGPLAAAIRGITIISSKT